jgi:hypothetical protein
MLKMFSILQFDPISYYNLLSYTFVLHQQFYYIYIIIYCVFGDITPCNSVEANQYVGGRCHLHIQS